MSELTKKRHQYRIALSQDKKRWRIYGNNQEIICDRVLFFTNARTETTEERKRIKNHDYTGPGFVIFCYGLLEKVPINNSDVYKIS